MRSIAILTTVLRHRLDRNVERFAGRHWLYRLSPLRLLPAPRKPDAARLREALVSLGPIFVKFGQILSTRRDLLPVDYADELAELQDRVPPFDSAVAVARIESSLGEPLDALFASFERTPIASASLAQVHAATMPNGDEVVVKVIRPDIERVIRKDLALMYGIARMLARLSGEARRLHLPEIVADYERTIFDELNLLKEAANTATLRQNFDGSELLYAPKVYWQRCSESVLVLERIRAVPISDLDALRRAGADMRVLAERGVETFFTQVFRHNFFHADMHPGNIFVNVDNPAAPSYIAIDCAIIGTLTEADQNYLARNVLAFLNRDYSRIAQLHLESGWVPPETDQAAFEAVVRQLLEPLFQRPLKEISFGHFLFALFRTARRFNMEVQPQLVLLQKTLLNIEGLGRQIYPDLDLWSTAKPFMERWMRDRFGPAAALRRLAAQAPALLAELPDMPDAAALLRRLRQLDRLAAAHGDAMQRLAEALARRRRAPWRAVPAAMLIAAAAGLLWPSLADALAGGEYAAPIVLGAAAALAGGWLIGRG